jgi:hypothetical protein
VVADAGGDAVCISWWSDTVCVTSWSDTFEIIQAKSDESSIYVLKKRLKSIALHQVEAEEGTFNMLAYLGLILRRHCQFLTFPFVR